MYVTDDGLHFIHISCEIIRMHRVLQVSPLNRTAEGGNETQQCSAPLLHVPGSFQG